MKTTRTALIFASAIVISALFLGKAYVDRAQVEGSISVTGLGKADFSSDLVVWEARFNAQNEDLQKAYAELEESRALIKAYLLEQGIASESLVFSALSTREKKKAIYSPDGDYMGERFEAYVLSQSLSIESTEVDKVERVSREVTELLKQGVNLYSDAPRYYYTKLADLKIEMISKATEDARIRAETIAKNSGGELGKLSSARMGVFQITGQHSNESYSWGGTFNTSDREKTASITMKLDYEVD